MNEWLLENAGYPIRYNISRIYNLPVDCLEAQENLLKVPEVQYWLDQLDFRQNQKMYGNIHGSHDYRLENILGKLTQLGLHAGMPALDSRCEVYRHRLADQNASQREAKLSFHKLYSFYDGELIPASFLALAGYEDPAIQHIRQKRLDILYEFTKQRRYDIYIDGSKLPGVPREWQPWIVDPDLYADGQIHIPVPHDIVLLSTFPISLPEYQQNKINTVIRWLLSPEYKKISLDFGYFWIPGGSYNAKAVCWKFDLPDPDNPEIRSRQTLVLRAHMISKYMEAQQHEWLKRAVNHLEAYKMEDGSYLLPKEYLIERKDSYWIFASHMGMAENRRIKNWHKIESTYWIELISVLAKVFSLNQTN
jgi:hypothetical protein